jgi:hypothetical protein
MSKLLTFFLLICSFSTFASLELEQELLNDAFVSEVGMERASEIFYEELALEKEAQGIQTLAKIEVTHGRWGLGVGNGSAFIKTDSNDNIQELSIDVSVGLLGINSRIKQKISISSLLSGKALKFYMDGAKKPSLKIQPSDSFTKTGGSAKFMVLNSKGGYESTSVSISKDRWGTYTIKKGRSEVNNIKVNMRGLNISTMYVGSYSLY